MTALIAAVATLALVGVEALRRHQVRMLTQSNEYLRQRLASQYRRNDWRSM